MRYTFVESEGLAKYIEEQWLRGLYYETLEDRTKEIHITDLTNPCAKSVILAKKYGVLSYEEIDKNFLKKTWAGKKLHETPFGQYHEYAFRYKFADGRYGYIYGSADEILDGIVIDKKYYSFIPKRPYEHHIEQVLFYLAILSDNHERLLKKKYEKARPLDVVRGALMYIDREELQVGIFFFEPIDIEEIREEMIKRAEVIRRGLLYGEIPKGVKSYMCKWCMFKNECDDWKEVSE